MHIPFTLNTDLQTGICFAGKVSVKIYFVLINKPLQQMTSSQRSCQYSCSIPDCVLPAAVCTHVLYQGPDQCTQIVQYRPCMTSFQLVWIWKLQCKCVLHSHGGPQEVRRSQQRRITKKWRIPQKVRKSKQWRRHYKWKDLKIKKT